MAIGAINLEQLDELLLSLKTYWDYSNQKGLIDEVRAYPTKTPEPEYMLAYEL